jgi:hypothetical protein
MERRCGSGDNQVLTRQARRLKPILCRGQALSWLKTGIEILFQNRNLHNLKYIELWKVCRKRQTAKSTNSLSKAEAGISD